MRTCLLALDLATQTGWCFGNGAQCVSGTQSFKNDRYSGGGMRYLRFERWLNDLADMDSVTEVVFEEVRSHKGVDAAHVYGGFMAVLTKWCEARSIPYQGVPVGEIKKFATGKGNAPKTDADKERRNAKARAKGRAEYVGLSVTAAVEGWGYRPADDNETDAIALFHLWLAARKNAQT